MPRRIQEGDSVSELERQLVDLADRTTTDLTLAQQFQVNPAGALKTAAAGAGASGNPLGTDKWIYRIVVLALGLIGLVAAVGGIVLVSGDRTVPEILIALGSAAVGAMAGLLAPSPAGERG
jgi:hypothetical protein